MNGGVAFAELCVWLCVLVGVITDSSCLWEVDLEVCTATLWGVIKKLQQYIHKNYKPGLFKIIDSPSSGPISVHLLFLVSSLEILLWPLAMFPRNVISPRTLSIHFSFKMIKPTSRPKHKFSISAKKRCQDKSAYHFFKDTDYVLLHELVLQFTAVSLGCWGWTFSVSLWLFWPHQHHCCSLPA